MIKLTPTQMHAIAQEYCRIRTEQDGIPRNFEEQIAIAEIMFAWYMAFSSVLEAAPAPGWKPPITQHFNDKGPTV